MPLEVIYVVRHGFRSSWSVDAATGVYTAHIPSPTGIPTDPALTSHGTRQAEELGRHLMAVSPQIDAVYSSPYYRCLQTISPFVELKRASQEPASASSWIRPEHGIREWFGSAPWDHPVPASLKVLKGMFPACCDGYVSAKTPSSKGETLAQLYERVATTLRTLIERSDAEGHRAIVICSHAATIISIGRVLTGRVPSDPEVDDFKAFTCGLSVYRRQRGDNVTDPSRVALGGWECELNSDCSFLSNGAERGWKFAGDESFPGTGTMSNDMEPKL